MKIYLLSSLILKIMQKCKSLLLENIVISLKQLAHISFILMLPYIKLEHRAHYRYGQGNNYQTLVCLWTPARLPCRACLALEFSDQPARNQQLDRVGSRKAGNSETDESQGIKTMND